MVKCIDCDGKLFKNKENDYECNDCHIKYYNTQKIIEETKKVIDKRG